MKNLLALCSLTLLLGLVSISNAQTISSFYTLDLLNGLNLEISNNSLNAKITLDNNPYFIMNSQTYQITQLFGFFALSDNANITASASTQNGWGFVLNPNNDPNIAGWHNPSKNASILPGQNKSFSYTALNTQEIDDYGYHVQVSSTLPTGGNTLYIRNKIVPEPSVIASLVIPMLALLHRRKK